MVIHTKVSRVLPNWCATAAQSPEEHYRLRTYGMIKSKSSCFQSHHQKDTFQMSHNLGFDFWLQHMEKPNPRAHKQHLLKISPPFLQFLPLKFSLSFSQIFSKIFLMIFTSLLSSFNPKSQQKTKWGIPYKQGTKGHHMR